MSLRSLVRFWRTRSSRRRCFAPARRKLWFEVLEDRTLPAGGLDLLGTQGLDAQAASSQTGNNTGQPLPLLTPVPFDPTAGTSAVTPASLTLATRFYLDLLHRSPQPSEAAFWAAALDNGRSREAVAGGFTLGDEYRGNLIRADYRALLGRDPEAGALEGWLARLQAGLTEEQLTALVLGSQEFFQQQGGTADAWLTGVYGVVLGRTPDATGFMFWLNVMHSGAPREAVAYLIVSSAEGRTFTIQDTYQALLRRDAEAGGLASWQAGFDQGQSVGQVVAGIAAAGEYLRGTTRANPLAVHVLTITGLATPQGPLALNASLTENTLIVQGGGAPGQSFVVAVDGVATTRGRISQSGGLSVSPSRLPDSGPHQITLRFFEGTGEFSSSNSFGINVDPSVATVRLRSPGLVGSSTPTLTVEINPRPGMVGPFTVAIDVDVNHDGDFSDPGEQGFTQATVQPGTNTITLDELKNGAYRVRAELSDGAGGRHVSGVVFLGVNPRNLVQRSGPPSASGSGNQGAGTQGNGSGLIQGSGRWLVAQQSSGSSSGSTGQLTVGPNVNASRALGNQSEPTIAVDPTNPMRQFVAANNNESLVGLFASFSSDGGRTWTSRIIADGTDGLPAGFADPSAAWDEFGNLFFTYINDAADATIVTLSTDGGVTFRAIDRIPSLDQPTVTTGQGMVWVSVNAADPSDPMLLIGPPLSAAGAPVTGLGAVGRFGPQQFVPNSAPIGGNFGDIAIGPNGQVMVSYQSSLVSVGAGPDQIFVSVDPDGLGPAGFSTPVVATATSIGPQRPIPAQAVRNLFGASSDLAYDRSGGPHTGRAYLVYTDALDVTSDDLNIFARFSDDDGQTWSNPVRVNDDLSSNSQFFSTIALDQTSGNIAVSWYDARNDAGGNTGPLGTGPNDTDTMPNTDVMTFATVSLDGGLTFLPNIQVARDPSNAVRNTNNSNQFGEYMGLAFVQGTFYPAWVDNSRTLDGNPNDIAFEIATAAVRVPGATPTPGGIGGGDGTPIALPDDTLEPNDTSDRATNFGALAQGTQTNAGLTIGRHANGLPDADWFRWTTSTAGTVTVTVNYQPPAGGDLHVRVFTLSGQNALVELGSSLNTGVRTQRVSVAIGAGQPLLVWVFGFDFAQANYDLSVELR